MRILLSCTLMPVLGGRDIAAEVGRLTRYGSTNAPAIRAGIVRFTTARVVALTENDIITYVRRVVNVGKVA